MVDMLRLSLLTPREIIMGKFTAARRTYGLVLAASLAPGLYMLPRALETPWGIISWAAGVASIVTYACVTLSLTLLGSVLMKRSANALVLSYAFCAAVFLGSVMAATTLDQFLASWGVTARGRRVEGVFAFFRPALPTSMPWIGMRIWTCSLLHISLGTLLSSSG